MSEEEKFVPVEIARKLISEIVDEEHLHDAGYERWCSFSF